MFVLQIQRVTEILERTDRTGGPDLVTLADLLESAGIAKELNADELEWVTTNIEPLFDKEAEKVVRRYTTTSMDTGYSLDLWLRGVEKAWSQSDRTHTLRDVLLTCIDFDKWGIEPEFNEFMRRCDYTASVRGYPPAVMERMQQALIDFVASVAAEKLVN